MNRPSLSVLLAPLALCVASFGLAAQTARAPSSALQFVVTSDAHYGITRAKFRGGQNVDAHVVNAALVAAVNALPAQRFPADSGVAAGERINILDLLLETGDIANRAEDSVQSAAASWAQFTTDYLRGVRTLGRNGKPTELLVLPGNHDASNAVGFYKPLTPPRDATAMIEIYNRLVRPRTPLTAETYDYRRDRVHASRTVAGVHLVFVHIWPDSAERDWIDRDLRTVAPGVPVLLFTHDQPDVEPKHLRNPNAPGDVNATDKFENLLSETYKDGTAMPVAAPGSAKDKGSPIEERALAEFVRQHPQIRAYFHGNSNAHEVYTYRGPDRTVALPTVRIDSPMKGHDSATDETRLSFAVVSVDKSASRLTVRECLWNADGGTSLRWGATHTIALR